MVSILWVSPVVVLQIIYSLADRKTFPRQLVNELGIFFCTDFHASGVLALFIVLYRQRNNRANRHFYAVFDFDKVRFFVFVCHSIIILCTFVPVFILWIVRLQSVPIEMNKQYQSNSVREMCLVVSLLLLLLLRHNCESIIIKYTISAIRCFYARKY